jgi:hypothetical protein
VLPTVLWTRYAAAVTDPTKLQPVDPWAGRAPVVPPGSMDPAEPYVIVVERPRKRRWAWFVGGLAVLGLLCCVGAIAVWTPIGKEYPAYLELGDTAAGLNRVQDSEIDLATAELEADMFRKYGVDDGRAAIFADPAAPERRVILLVATKLILDPAKELDNGIKGVADRKLRDLTDYSRLGGHQKCANTEHDKQPVVICAWTDYGSIGLGIFYGSWTMDACATVLRDLRTAVVRRG